MSRIEVKDLPNFNAGRSQPHLEGFLSLANKAYLKEHAYNVAGISLLAPQVAFAKVLDDDTARIVDLLDGTRPQQDIEAVLSDDLGKSSQQAVKIVEDFLAMLIPYGLIQGHKTRRSRPIRRVPRRTSYSLDCIDLALTHRCNMSCVYCINVDNNKEMSSEMVDKVIESTLSMGVGCVSISGGEPTLHPRFWDIVRELGKNAVNVTVETNGSTMSRSSVRKLAKYGVFGISLSIDSLDEEDYPALGQNALTPQHLLSVIEWLTDAGLHVRTSAVLVEGINSKRAKALGLWKALDELDVGVQCYSSVIPQGKGKNHAQNADMFNVAAELGKKVFGERLRKQTGRDRVAASSVMKSESHVPRIECGAGVHRVAIAPDGRVSTCLQMADLAAGWLPDEELEDIWESSPVFEFFRKKENVESPICRKCEHWDQCRGGCKVRAGLYGGSIAYPDLWSCATYGHVRRAKRLLNETSSSTTSFRKMVSE
jgi:radical SAM protein with 4Fe4S-binding SPASM domain